MTDATTSPSVATVERYVEFWNAETIEDQKLRASGVFTEDVEYHAPVGIMHGSRALIDFRDQFAAHHGVTVGLRARRAPERHHDRARLLWEIMVGGESFATGTDVLELDADDRIRSISSFLDRAPDGFDPHAHD